MHDEEPLLTRQELLHLFDQMSEAAQQRGVRIELFVVGGAAMALVYNTERVTRDLDAVFEPKTIVYEVAAQVARASQLELADDWLNDGVKGFLPGPDPSATVFYENDGISVRVASPRYLFVLKAMAARESDEDDLRTLYPLCGFNSKSEALDTIEAAYPNQPIKLTVQYLVEAIADEQ
jgi:predicted nucleotidyltransferase